MAHLWSFVLFYSLAIKDTNDHESTINKILMNY